MRGGIGLYGHALNRGYYPIIRKKKANALANYVKNNRFSTARIIIGDESAIIIVDRINNSSVVLKNTVGLNQKFKYYARLGAIRASGKSYFHAIQPAYNIEKIKEKLKGDNKRHLNLNRLKILKRYFLIQRQVIIRL